MQCKLITRKILPGNQRDLKKSDFYTFSWYKVYGPHLAMMYGKLDLLTRMKGINHYFFKNEDVPYKFQPGNFNFELTYGLTGLLEYLIELHDHHSTAKISSEKEKYRSAFSLIAEYEEELAQPLLKYLNSVPEVRIIGDVSANAAKRVPTISFVHEKMKSPEIVAEVDKEEIGIRFGDFMRRN